MCIRAMHAGLLALVAACSFDGSGLSGAQDGAGDGAPDLELDGAVAGVDADVTADAARGMDGAPAVELRLNAGGLEHQGTDYPGTWSADLGRCDSDTWTESGEILGTSDDPLFEKYRYGDPGESINCQLGEALESGTYEVTLLFGEVWYGAGCTGSQGEGVRVFDIVIEGQIQESGIDTVAEGGCCHEDADDPGAPFTRTFDVAVEDGAVDVVLQASQGDTAPMVSAIQVVSL